MGFESGGVLPRREQGKSPWFGALVALGIGVLATATLYQRARFDEVVKFRSNFDYRVFDAQDRINKRMAAMEQVLWSTRAVFVSAETMDRIQFRAYVAELDLPRHSPGIQALGFVKYLAPEELEAHELSVRESIPLYQVYPPGGRAHYAPIMFIAPYEGRNVPALGFDMLSEPVRREAMERSRDEGRSALSGPVQLVQDIAAPHQVSALMYVPVYAEGPQPVTPEERLRRLEGWAYVAFRMNDLMAATIDGRPEISTRIYDGVTLSSNSLIFDSMADYPPEPIRPGLVARKEISVGGRTWTLVMEARKAFGTSFRSRTPEVVAVFGSGLSVAVSMLIFVLMGARARAEQRARSMNRELIEAHAAVERSEQRLRFAVQGAGLVSWDYDAQEERLTVSERLSELLGIVPPQLGWKRSEFGGVTHPDDQEPLARAIADHFQRKTPSFKVEVRARHVAGHWVWLLVSGTVVSRAPDGTPLRAAGTLMDLSERKREEAERASLIERFHRAERSAAMGTLASGMAHEINNPMTVVIANVAFAQHDLAEMHDGPALDEAKAALQEAAEAATRVRALVADLNALTDQQQDLRAKSDLRAVVRRALEHTRMLEQAGLPVEADVPPLPHVVGAEAELVQLFVCLVSNALQATGDRPNRVRITARRVDHHVVVRVSDEGVGMPPEQLARVFDPFFTTRAPGRGKGLGLSTALSIARSVGGNLELESTPGVGTTAVVTLVEADAAGHPMDAH